MCRLPGEVEDEDEEEERREEFLGRPGVGQMGLGVPVGSGRRP